MQTRPRSPAKKFSVKSFGCRASQADGAAIADDLRSRGLESASGPADVVVINTCTVTSEADQDARQSVRRVHRENPDAEILVTGCYAQRRPEELAKLPGVKWVVGNSHKTLIGDVVAPTADSLTLVTPSASATSAQAAYHGEINLGGTLVGNIFDQQQFLSAPVLEAGPDRTRPNLKIQDGCGNRCSFCVIPSVRGNSRSAVVESVIEQIAGLAERYSEVVLTGINLGRLRKRRSRSCDSARSNRWTGRRTCFTLSPRPSALRSMFISRCNRLRTRFLRGCDDATGRATMQPVSRRLVR